MEKCYDYNGRVFRMKGKIGSHKEIVLNTHKDIGFLHLNDYSKCWIDGDYDQSLKKTITLRWDQVLTLDQCIDEMKLNIHQMLHFQVIIRHYVP